VRWLLTGGAGYIGAHVLRAFLDSGRAVVVVDDLSTGLARKVPHDVPLVRIDVRDTDALARVLADHHVRGVVHLAGKKAVDESVSRPLHYYRQNVDGALALVEAMSAVGVTQLVYSSSAAVYGVPARVPVREDDPTVPTSPYGETKLVGEWVFRDAVAAHGLSVVALRYFNVAGAGSDELGDTGAFNLLPMLLRAVTDGRPAQVFGDDYPTPDGTCVRDYIHVSDLADAHVVAAEAVQTALPGFAVCNIGLGRGSSVLEVIEAVGRATGQSLAVDRVGRRPGDPPEVVACADRARADLGWFAHRGLDEMASSAWSAWLAHPPAA
jgi:UDP-glucose 4-epimerase